MRTLKKNPDPCQPTLITEAKQDSSAFPVVVYLTINISATGYFAGGICLSSSFWNLSQIETSPPELIFDHLFVGEMFTPSFFEHIFSQMKQLCFSFLFQRFCIILHSFLAHPCPMDVFLTASLKIKSCHWNHLWWWWHHLNAECRFLKLKGLKVQRSNLGS